MKHGSPEAQAFSAAVKAVWKSEVAKMNATAAAARAARAVSKPEPSPWVKFSGRFPVAAAA